MKIRIHRGAEEIGGNCVEIHAQGASILIDLGEPIMGDTFGKDALPNMPGLTDGSNKNLLAIVISHPHLDHYGLVRFAAPDIPKYIGNEADKLLQAASAFTHSGIQLENTRHYRNNTPFQIGPFKITPYIADHSAFDSYSFLIEANEKRLFYSGDLRAHGWKKWAFEKLIKNPPTQINAMLLEGTTLSRETENHSLTEPDLVDAITEKIHDTKGIVLAAFAGQNIDRFVTFFKATRKTKRIFVADCYIAHLLHTIKRKTLPDPTSGAMRIFLPKRMKSQIIRNKRFDVVEPFKKRRIYHDEMIQKKHKLVITFRESMAEDFEKDGILDQARLIYSMWPGYLEKNTPNLQDRCQQNGVMFDILHSSGHASGEDLARFVQAIKPQMVIPIHSLAPERFKNLGAPVKIIPNHQWHTIE